MMEDSRDTVIVTGLSRDIQEDEFITFFNSKGEVLKSEIATQRSAGIVTYSDPEHAEQAIETLNGQKLKGSTIKVQLANIYYKDHTCGPSSEGGDTEINTAWSIWSRDNKRDEDTGFGGGQDGKGGQGGRGNQSGHDGEAGESGPDGIGGAIGRREVSGEGQGHDGGGGGGKGGKGGQGDRGVPSGHDGQDGESGPGGKGGAGGRPAVPYANPDKRPFDNYGSFDHDGKMKNDTTLYGHGNKKSRQCTIS